ncbi:hypothetical protein IKF15_00605 [Candidatus Saccharibacteria bacterium]|nr:hypothetical protein [Candidatus Saccharibacteria bacterium]
MTVPDIFYERDGIRKLTANAVKLYFHILTLEEKYGGAFLYSCERFMQDLNIARGTFFKARAELISRGFIAISSTADRDSDGTFRQSVRYYVKEE